MSGTVRDHVEGKLDATFDDLGEQMVKNISRPVRVYRARGKISTAQTHGGVETVLALPDKPSIAVLPFANMSGDPEQEYFSDGITEDIITAISRIRQFFVIARNTTFTYKGRAVDVQAVARDLGVRYVLEGSVRKAGNRLRITAQLIDGTTGNHIWADRYDRELEDIFDIQDEITQTIAGQIEPELGRAEHERMRLEPPDNLDAWALYHRAMAHYQKWTRDENLAARELFRAAADRDANFAAAFAGLSWTYSQERLYGAAEADMSAAAAHGRRAIELDDKNAFAHLALGRAIHLSGDSRAGKIECELALQLNPSSAAAHIQLGLVHLFLHDVEKAVLYISQGIRLSPFDPESGVNQGRLANAYLAAQQYALSVTHARQSAGKWIHWIPHAVMVSALAHLGQTTEAKQELEALNLVKPGCSVQYLRDNWPPHHPDYVDHMLDGLRKAGLPE